MPPAETMTKPVAAPPVPGSVTTVASPAGLTVKALLDVLQVAPPAAVQLSVVASEYVHRAENWSADPACTVAPCGEIATVLNVLA